MDEMRIPAMGASPFRFAFGRGANTTLAVSLGE